ncbi:MAG TPA: hypothetical protein VL096_11350 [Pirellulaceae bacterium]|nr:hypothetical protein [Pirellulaceae bacterium]
MSALTTSHTPSLSSEFGSAWNRFWFTPSDPLPLCLLRMGVGAILLLYLGVLTPDLTIWYGAEGIVTPELYDRVVIGGSEVNQFAYWSYLSYLTSPTQLKLIHAAGLAIAALFTVGCFTRVTSVLSLVVLLQYVHRAPFLSGQVEPVLAMLLLYLCIGPCGAQLSIDAWRRKSTAPPQLSWTATVALRLIQIHLAALYFTMGTSKLYGDTWSRGEGLWALMSLTRTRIIDWSFLRDHGYVINAWTHLQVYYELTFAALIWPRFTRPVMLGLGAVLWLLLLPVSGLIAFCLLMLIANVVYVPADVLRRWVVRQPVSVVATA